MSKKKVKNYLDSSELEFIRDREDIIDGIISVMSTARKFKKGDYLIAFEPGNPYRARYQITNSYNAPKKFVVVHTDKHNFPYIKEISKRGKPTGPVISTIRFNGTQIVEDSIYEFEVDPDYTDSIIMMDEENYDGAAIHRIKSETFKEITDYNKNHKIPVKDLKVLAQWFNSNVKIGTILYRSIVTSYIVQEIMIVPKDYAGRFKYEGTFMTVLTNKGKTLRICINDFKYSALYDAKPRSYNELKDPK